MGSGKHTRRQFLAGAATAAAGASLAGCFPGVGGHWPEVTEACQGDTLAPVTAPSPVVEVQRADSVLTTGTGLQIQDASVPPMLDAALTALAGTADYWPVLLPGAGPATRIGIKVNVLNGRCPTSVAVVKALVDSLKARLEMPAEQILVWDRRLDELARAGFSGAQVGATVIGTWMTDTESIGPGYTDAICGVVAGAAPRLSRILTELTDVTINVPVVKAHGESGVTAALKNAYGIIHNPGAYHRNLSQALPALYALPPIRDRIRLTIADGLLMSISGGTSDPVDTVGARLLAASDPLAHDKYVLDMVNALRAARPVPLVPVSSALTGWLDEAQRLGLGSLSYALTQITQ